MFGFFTPRYLKDGKEMLHAARRVLNYKRDQLQPADLDIAENLISRLKEGLRSRNQSEVEAATQEIDQFFGKNIPALKHPEIRENCEVFLVAIVIALGVRTFFLQPFTIPTGSMQPTLNGIIVTKTETLPPNPLVRAVDMAIYGRSYFNAVSQTDDTVRSIRETTRFRFFSYTEVVCDKQSFLIPIPIVDADRVFGLSPGTTLRAGQVFARGYADTGDHVFVNKVAYNFRMPRRGEVFVFNTGEIPALTPPGYPSQYYIKRLAGLPGDELRIDPPKLFVNGQLAPGEAFARVMSGTLENPKDGYRGYGYFARFGNIPLFLANPDSPYIVPERHYFALGDNSYHSSDSRYWGPVPEQSLMGYGMFVYWPFTKHWGFIK